MSKILNKYLMVGIIGLIIGIVICYLYFQTDQTKMKIKWKIQGQELEIDLSKDVESFENILNRMFSRDFSKAGVLDWLRNKHRVYIYHDLKFIDEIKKLNPSEEFSKRLFELERTRVGPWSYQIDTILIGVPNIKDQPKEGFANVCESSIFHGKSVKIRSLRTKEEITVFCSGFYICPKEFDTPDLQLNWKDAMRIFGYNNFKKYETAIAVIVNK